MISLPIRGLSSLVTPAVPRTVSRNVSSFGKISQIVEDFKQGKLSLTGSPAKKSTDLQQQPQSVEELTKQVLHEIKNPKKDEGTEAALKEYASKQEAHHTACRSYYLCLAEINGTEFSFNNLNAATLRNTYKKQLENFERERIHQLEADGVDSEIIEKFHHLYQMRAYIPLSELTDAIRRQRWAEKDYRVVATMYEDERWKLKNYYWIGGQHDTYAFLNNFILNSFDKKNKAWRNKDLAARNVRIARGFVGLLRAVQQGLTPEHKNQLVEKLTKIGSISSKVDQVIEKLRGFHAAKDNASGRKYLQDFVKDLPNSSKALLVQKLQQLDDDIRAGHTHLKRGLVVSEKETEQSFQLDSSKELIRMIVLTQLNTEVGGNVQLVNTLNSLPKLSMSEIEDILSPFSSFSDDLEDSLLNDAVNPHPLAHALWQPRAEWIEAERISYTKKFEEHFSLFKPIDENPKAQKLIEDNPEGFFYSPVSDHPPWNSALEEIFHAKLRRLATDFYGLDLGDNAGILEFYTFMHTYDVSPGEDTLDRCHSCPPPHHTYEELPILKFDGFEQDFDGIQLAEYEREKRLPELLSEIQEEVTRLVGAPVQAKKQQKEREM